MKPLALLLILATALLAGCSGDDGSAYYNQHPHELMQQVVKCENNGGALANTPLCRKVLRINSQMF
ncbi:MAG TPA: EexN family lipoprotein [Acidiphilium sp.]